jgi:hypothetical protein
MNDDTKRDTPGTPTLTFAGGGWVIALAGVLVALLLGWSLLGPLLGRHPIGDGRTVESYGFDLSTMLIDRAELVPSGNPRGFLPSLDDPKHLRGAEVLVYNEQNRPKYLVTTDRVIGAVINGQPHAWPLSMMNAHEVVNDTVAGIPVAATYSPLCDSVLLFDRRVGGVARRFEVSGLLVDSNLVVYDKAVEGGDPASHVPSLFLQLERRAIAGPLAQSAAVLEPLPGACITSWADWLALHPTTTVTLRDPAMIRRMKEISYARYFLGPNLEYPASPLPSEASLAAAGLRLKSPMIAFRLESGWKAIPVEAVVAKAESERRLRFSVDGVELQCDVPAGPAIARLVRVDGAPLVTVPCLYFALEAVAAPREPVAIVAP